MAARKIKLTHPGKILRQEFMEPAGLSAYALAKALGVPLPRVNDLRLLMRNVREQPMNTRFNALLLTVGCIGNGYTSTATTPSRS